MDAAEERFEVHFTKAVLLHINDSLRFVRVGESGPISSRIEEEQRSRDEREGRAVNRLKHKVITMLQKAVKDKDDSAKKYTLKISYLEAVILENMTTNSLQNDIHRAIDLEVQPFIVEWELGEKVEETATHPELLVRDDSAEGSDKVDRDEALRRYRSRSERGTSGSPSGRGSSSPHEKGGD